MISMIDAVRPTRIFDLRCPPIALRTTLVCRVSGTDSAFLISAYTDIAILIRACKHIHSSLFDDLLK